VGGATPAAVSASTFEELASNYTMTVRGQQYTGSVEESDGEYTASVPTPAGATASASNEQAAETGLAARIDELV
jgi:hypothetical protein